MGVLVPWSLEPIWRGSAAGLTATLVLRADIIIAMMTGKVPFE